MIGCSPQAWQRLGAKKSDHRPLPLDLSQSAGDLRRIWVEGTLYLGADRVLLTEPEAREARRSWDECGTRGWTWSEKKQPGDLVEIELTRVTPPQPQPRPCSVVVPVYNTPWEDLERCVRSVDQSLGSSAHEILILDDASANSEVLEQNLGRLGLGNSFRYLRGHENLGPGAARNRGVAEARNDFIFFVDSDNEVLEGYFTALSTELENDAAVAGCSMVYADSTAESLRLFCAGPLSVQELLKRNTCDVGIGLNRRHPLIQKLIEKTGGIFSRERMLHFEDWEMHLCFSLLSLPRKIVPAPLYRYTRNPGGRNSRNSEYQFISEIQVLVSAFERADAVDPARARDHIGPLLETILAKVTVREKERLEQFRHLYALRRLLKKIRI